MGSSCRLQPNERLTMNPLNLVPAPYRAASYFVGSLILVVAVAAAVNKAYNWTYNNGVNSERTTWQARESGELAAANKKILELTTDARNQEAQNAINLQTISAYYEESKRNDKVKNDKVVDDLNNGVIRLRDKYAKSTTCETTGPGRTGETATGTGERPGETGTEFSTTAAKFLYELTAEADEIVEQLSACQAVVLEDRRLCGVKLIE